MMSYNTSKWVEWLWLSNLNPYSFTEEPEWSSYSPEESELIEEAYQAKREKARLNHYYIDFANLEQVRRDDSSKRRPVKRIEHDKGEWIKRIKKLGAGSFGTVYQGIYRETQEVAYKVIKKKLSQDAQKEANILKTLRHPNIVQYIDIIHTANHTLLVMELIDGSTLWSYIENTPASADYWIFTRDSMIDVAYAMSYLHEKNIVHADLKSDNILLRRKGSAVLSDFGLSKVIQDSESDYEDTSRGALRWRAPELCQKPAALCSFETDIWAYGCVLIEIAVKEVPWQEFSHPKQLLDALNNEENNIVFQEICRNLTAPDGFRKLAASCCSWFRANRPTIDRIIRDLRSISNRDLESYSENDQDRAKAKKLQQKKKYVARQEPLYSDQDSDQDVAEMASNQTDRKQRHSYKSDSKFSHDDSSVGSARYNRRRYTTDDD